MNRVRKVRLSIFVIAMLLLLSYPFYVRHNLSEMMGSLSSENQLSNVVIQNMLMNDLLIFISLVIILFPFSVFYIFLMGRFSVGERLLFRRNQVHSNTKNNFLLDDWYNATRRFLGNDWFVHMHQAMEAAKLIPKKTSGTYISPAANRGIYEKVLYNDLKSKGHFIKFIMADIDEIENNAVKNRDDENLIFFTGKEAMKIDEYLLEAGEMQADIIFDIKGSLWYTFRSDMDPSILLEKFYNVLCNEGVIVLDHSKRRFLSFCIYYVFGHVSWYVETSTGFLLNKNKKRHKTFRRFMDNHFEQKELSFQNEFGDVFDILVLKKKAQ